MRFLTLSCTCSAVFCHGVQLFYLIYDDCFFVFSLYFEVQWTSASINGVFFIIWLFLLFYWFKHFIKFIFLFFFSLFDFWHLFLLSLLCKALTRFIFSLLCRGALRKFLSLLHVSWHFMVVLSYLLHCTKFLVFLLCLGFIPFLFTTVIGQSFNYGMGLDSLLNASDGLVMFFLAVTVLWCSCVAIKVWSCSDKSIAALVSMIFLTLVDDRGWKTTAGSKSNKSSF